MMDNQLPVEKIIDECTFQASRSSGAGGQHVNKVSSRVELRLDIASSQLFSEEQRQMIFDNLSGRINKQGVLILASEKTRSQYKNKEDCIEKLLMLLQQALHKDKARFATRPTRNSRQKRLEGKKQHGAKKQNRRKPEL